MGAYSLLYFSKLICEHFIDSSWYSSWCGREDSNLHRIAPTSPSSWRVYHSATTAYSLFMAHHNEINGAGEENRTLTVSLEGWSSTIKLHPLIMVGKTGFEPATPWSQTRCSTKLSHFPFFKMAVQTGIEPAISCVTGRHVNRYTTGPFFDSLSLSFVSFFVKSFFEKDFLFLFRTSI